MWMKGAAAAVSACLPSKFNSLCHVEQEVSVEVRAQEGKKHRRDHKAYNKATSIPKL